MRLKFRKGTVDTKRSIQYWFFWLRETKEGWPLLTVETEVNGDSKSTNQRGSSLVVSLGLSCQYKRFLHCLGCSSQPNTNIFFLAVQKSVHFMCPHRPGKLGSGQAVVLGRLACLLVHMCLWVYSRTSQFQFEIKHKDSN